MRSTLNAMGPNFETIEGAKTCNRTCLSRVFKTLITHEHGRCNSPKHQSLKHEIFPNRPRIVKPYATPLRKPKTLRKPSLNLT